MSGKETLNSEWHDWLKIKNNSYLPSLYKYFDEKHNWQKA